jgi:hypothetical protein
MTIEVMSLGIFEDRGRYPTPAKTAEAYYNINIPTKGERMLPNRLKQTLDADYGTDGWTLISIEDNTIRIKFYLTGDVITFDKRNWVDPAKEWFDDNPLINQRIPSCTH